APLHLNDLRIISLAKWGILQKSLIFNFSYCKFRINLVMKVCCCTALNRLAINLSINKEK
ncbi:hypothetical protein C0X90_11125, partial [Escherichia coli O119]|nr:hypothetical protein [Escherichia coli O119]